MATATKIVGAQCQCPIKYSLRVYIIGLFALQLLFFSGNSDAFIAKTSGNSRKSRSRSTVDTATTRSQTVLHHGRPRTLEDARQPPETRADLITFDLDDTLFPIAPVIKDANRALVENMRRLGYDRVSEDGINDSTRAVRNALDESGDGITYTELRKRAVRREMDRCRRRRDPRPAPPTAEEDGATAARLYDRWESERHASAERHLYPDAVPMLERLREDHPSVVIGAVTNGKGNPLEMAGTLAGYFDFCVSGEDDDVFPHRKPHAGIYEVAVRRYREIVRDRGSGDASVGDVDGGDGCNWYHVGDDLANDIGASAACGARAIWVDLLDEYGQTASKRVSLDPSRQPKWSSASQEDLEKRRIVGEKALTSITARIERLSDLPDAILTNLDSI